MSELINWFAEPLAFPFMQNALLTALIVSITCGLLSCYLVLKGWSLMGDAVSHAVLPGIVLAFVFGIPLQIGAFASGLLCSVGVGYLKNNTPPTPVAPETAAAPGPSGPPGRRGARCRTW